MVKYFNKLLIPPRATVQWRKGAFFGWQIEEALCEATPRGCAK